jgi:large subunit ribosomal protein L35Ae
MFKSQFRVDVSAIKVKVLSQPVYGRIMNYRTGIRTQTSRECLVQFADLGLVQGKIVGRKVFWNHGKSKLGGRIVGFHGRNGVVRVKFTKGVPGQALGTIVELVS